MSTELVITIPDNIVKELNLTEDTDFTCEIVEDGFIVIPKIK